MFMTKEERRKLWLSRIIFTIQAIALNLCIFAIFALLIWMENNGYLP